MNEVMNMSKQGISGYRFVLIDIVFKAFFLYSLSQLFSESKETPNI